jgi:hypothetical protein
MWVFKQLLTIFKVYCPLVMILKITLKPAYTATCKFQIYSSKNIYGTGFTSREAIKEVINNRKRNINSNGRKKLCLGKLSFSVDSLVKLFCAAMEQHVFCIFIDYRGHHRKGVAMEQHALKT